MVIYPGNFYKPLFLKSPLVAEDNHTPIPYPLIERLKIREYKKYYSRTPLPLQ